MTLPTFLIIGANKGGTTSLYNYLHQHPQVYLSPVKEPSFFALEGAPRPAPDAPEARWMRQSAYTLDEYRALFAGAGQARARGEASTAYLATAQAAASIQRHCPDIRLVALLRHPAERAYSNWRMYRRHQLEPLSFAEAVAAELAARRAGTHTYRKYVQLGFYHEQLTPYLERFERQQLKLVLYRDFVNQPAAVLREICAHIGVDPEVHFDMGVRYNTASGDKPAAPPAPGATTPWLRRIARRARRLLRPARPQATHTNEFLPETRRALIALYHDDMCALQTLWGRDLSAWFA